MMTLGGSLKRRERLSARLGDLLSLLFLASAALKHFEDQGRPVEDLPLLRWALEDHLRNLEQATLDLWRNFPAQGLARLLLALTFPTGLTFRGPDNALDHSARVLPLFLAAPCATLEEGGWSEMRRRLEALPRSHGGHFNPDLGWSRPVHA